MNTNDKLLRPRIKITVDCPACDGGRDIPLKQWCGVCGQDFTQDELRDWEPFHYAYERADEATIPCGHPAYKLREQDYCDECEGAGSYPVALTLAEFAALLAIETGKD